MKVLKHEKSYSKYCSHCSLLIYKRAKRKAPMEQRDCLWWQRGYHNCTNEQSTRRLRLNRDTFNFILNVIEDLITEEVSKFKEPVLPDRQLGLTM